MRVGAPRDSDAAPPPVVDPWPALLHPLPVAAIALTALNDHLLKAAGLLPAAVTGKLSDVAGLFFFPIAVVTAARAGRARFGRRWRGDGRLPIAVTWATGLAFALCKLSPALCRWLSPAAIVVPDPTDLVALPAVAAAWWWLARRRATPTFSSPAWTRLVVLAGAAVTAAATSLPPGPYVYQPLPMWRVTEPAPRSLACADVELWISKSGREGVGLTVGLRPRGAPCAIRIDRLAMDLPDRAPSPAVGTPEDIALGGTDAVYRYLAVPFDAAARRGSWRSASAELDLTDAAGPHALRFALAYDRAPTPTWGTFRDRARLPCGVSGQLLVTDTAPDGIHLVLRAEPESACTFTIAAVELRSGETIEAAVEPALAVSFRAGEDAQVPLFLPVDPTRVPVDSTRRRGTEPNGLRIWLKVAREPQEVPSWVSWAVQPVAPKEVQ